jgi:hypothetical protein
MPRVFLLSPAHCGGERARMILREEAAFDLALKIRTEEGAPIGEVFSFLSGLYFRGKMAYSRRFADPPPGVPGALVITPTRGLWPVDTPVTRRDLLAFAEVDIHQDDSRYRRPLERDLGWLRKHAPGAEVVLLGSVASAKYVSVLGEALGERLLFPPDFVGRGDMSRGGLMLRCARAGLELAYTPVLGAVRHGARPPKLPRLR